MTVFRLYVKISTPWAKSSCHFPINTPFSVSNLILVQYTYQTSDNDGSDNLKFLKFLNKCTELFPLENDCPILYCNASRLITAWWRIKLHKIMLHFCNYTESLRWACVYVKVIEVNMWNLQSAKRVGKGTAAEVTCRTWKQIRWRKLEEIKES